MSKYSLELRDIYNDKSYNLFDFDYPFYDENFREQFQEKFFQHYMFDEIGYPTIGYFKQRLKSKLNMIMPYYIQLYATKIASDNKDYLTNKDYSEIFVRELTGNVTGVNTNVSNGTNATTSSEAHTNENVGINSDTPQGQINDIELYMSNASKDNTTGSSSTEGDTEYHDNTTLNSSNDSTVTERTEMTAHGDIGTNSPADMVRAWRSILINIDEQILNELNSLFMQVY